MIGTLSQVNPNTAQSGVKDYYINFKETDIDRPVILSNTEKYDEMGEDFTIEVWIRKAVGQGEYRPIISKHKSSSTADDNGFCEFLLEVQWNDALNFFTGCGSYVNYGYYVAVSQDRNYPALNTYKVIQDRWTHVAVTVDWLEDKLGVPTGIAKIYADGVLVDAGYWAQQSPVCVGRKRIRQPNVPVRLGYYFNQENITQFFVGDIDELRIWNTARSVRDISSYYVGGIPLDSRDLISYHTFSEGMGSISSNLVVGSLGFPQVLFTNTDMWTNSDLKLAPNTAVTCPGYTVSAQPFGTENVDYYITKIIKNTDAKILWSDARDPRFRNIRREVTSADLPFNAGPFGLSNIFEYVPGKVVGIDYIYYEARNNGSFPEPSGPAYLVFETICCGNETADACRVCGGSTSAEQASNGECSYTCDKKGGVNDLCGDCNGNGLNCRGCDGIPFSNSVYDMCGKCAGNNECYGPCSGSFDGCGICNGNNSCCVEYKGLPRDRIDHILLSYTLEEMIQKLTAAKSIIQTSLDFVKNHTDLYKRDEIWDAFHVEFPSDLPRLLSNRILLMNSLCSVTDEFLFVLENFLVDYGSKKKKKNFFSIQF